MENFLKPFMERGVVYSLENVPVNTSDNTGFNYIKFLQKIIFKHDVIIELKQLLQLACTPEPFTIKNDIVKKLIVHINLLSRSDEDSKGKIEVVLYVFKTFVSVCKDDNVHIMQFFIVLSHLLGMNTIISANRNNETEVSNNVINVEYFNNAFGVDISSPSSVTFSIFKELLLCLSKLSINFNSLELQLYSKWLQLLIKKLAYFQPFQNIFLEIFSISADIDLKLLEGNFDDIFNNILAQKTSVDEDFCHSYSIFLEKALDICSKFQRTTKFIIKFLSSIKETPTFLVREIILPPNAINKFSDIVAVSSNQQSFSLFDILVQNLDECFGIISQKNSDTNALLLFITSDLLISFFKEVKLYAPSISNSTLQTFIDKLNAFKGSLQKFRTYLFNNTSFIYQNENIVKTFLELCIYCGEIEVLINCYKDSVLQPADIVPTGTKYDEWHCCLHLEQWKNLINIVIKSKLDALSPICFQLALHKCRKCKLEDKISDIDESTLKIIIHQLASGLQKFNIFQQLSPEDLTILMEALTIKQSKSVCKKIFKQLLENEARAQSAAWLCDSVLQENSLFILNLFSQILKETGSLLRDLIPDQTYSKMSWLTNDYFDESRNILPDSLQDLPEKMNFLLKNGKKIRKHMSRSAQQKETIVKIMEVFKLLPLPYMRGECRRLGLCFAIKIGVLLSGDENSARLPLESMCNFLASDLDASICFDMGLCVKWLMDISYEDKRVDDVRMKAIEILVRNSPNTKFGLSQMGEMIDCADTQKHVNQLKKLESRVVLYNEFGKCWQRAKKRKSDNDLIGSYRVKLAKIISDEARQLEDGAITPENSKILLKVLAIELNKAIKTNEESEISVLMEEKFPSHFDFAVKSLKKNFDEASVSFLTVVLQSASQLRKLLPKDSLFKIWKALKFYEKVNWRFFCSHSTDEEFSEILADLLKVSKKFLNSGLEKHSSNCFEIWVAFFEFSSESKRNQCQLRLQEFFNYVHDCDLLLRNLPIRKRIFLVKFACFCVSKKEVILTSHMLDTIIHHMLECLEDDNCSVEDFCSLFAAEMETASAILLRQFDWSKSKIHLTFVLFKRLLATLMRRCDASHQPGKDDVIKLSTCAFSMEKWVSLLIKREKDFARTTPYFITVLISSVASVTVLPAIKIHLVNCINHFLSISDSHTVSYLMRALKPGYQQVFNSMYNQFKKYHKYSGKI